MVIAACGSGAAHRGRTVVYASGADLQSVNPLLTVHPFAKQVERYVLLPPLVRYDSALVPRPYLARAWTWSEDRKSLTFRLQPGVRWGDGVPTTARDVAWTLSAARDAATGYPRLNDFADVAFVNDPNDSTVVIRFAHSQDAIPDVLTDLAILPARWLDSIPRTELRRADWNEHPIGNGPFRFVAHEAGRRWVFAANPDFPAALGGPPALERFIVVVVDEPTTKLAALTSGEIDFAGIQPAHAAFVRKNPALAVLDYPLIMPYGIVFNTRNPPFDDARVNSRQRDFTAAVLGTPGDPGLGYLQTLAELAGVRPAPDPASAQRLFRDSLPVAFLYHVRGVQGMNRRVSGVRMDVRGELPTIAGWRTEP